ncbi:hypothetical protein GpartN1_g2945.t1 [Galdieria partita]|uniref:EGF domain-specific O-linked N-acetylglucosamine transferase n=1 Tax=Galdieria partita TaxID=83374 RepID=A0A9C7UPQ0_9RHOD|nr:hypothetical protein GpartN1_g2945.t1 [Galdieria partita]
MKKKTRNYKKGLFLTVGMFLVWLFCQISRRKIMKENYSSPVVGNFSKNLAEYFQLCNALYMATSKEEMVAFSNCRKRSILIHNETRRNIALVKLNITEDAPVLVKTDGPTKWLLNNEWIETERKFCRNNYLLGLTWILPVDPFYFNGNIAHLHIFGAMRIWFTLEQLKSKNLSVKRILFIRRPSIKKCCPNGNQIQQTLDRFRTIFPLEIILLEHAVCLQEFLLIPPGPRSHNIQWGASHNVSLENNSQESLLVQTYAEYLKKVLLKNDNFFLKSSKRMQPHVLFVRRTGRRQLLNVEQLAIWSQSKKVTVSIIDFSKGTWSDHAKVVSSSDIFFSCHGADLTNMLLLPSRSVVVEVFPFKMAMNDGFQVMATYLGLKYLRYQERDFRNAVPYKGAECAQVFSNWTSIANIPEPSKTRGKLLDKCTNYMHTNLSRKVFETLLEQAVSLLHS